jgi:glycerate 2-kinase
MPDNDEGQVAGAEMQSRRSRGGHVLVAPDKFKGTLTATQAARHIAAGLRRVRGDLDIAQVPVADGGEGTVAAAIAAGYQPVRLGVRGPTGQPARAEFGWRDGTAIIEAAQACGLALLPGGRLQPLAATSFGVGELIAAAAARGARRIVLGLGGVASTDGGAGMVQALGGRLLDQAGRELPPGGAALAALHRLDLAGLSPLAGIEVLVATDVDSPLLGRHGAAAVYGPQKGASPADVAILEAGLARWADCAERALAGQVPGAAGRPGARPSPRVCRPRDEPGAGAAGGLGFAALAFLGARTRPGIELMLDLIGFAGRLRWARLVITGEGSLDAQTLHGKAPAGVARAAAAVRTPAASGAAPGPRGAVVLPVVAVAGRCTLSPAQLHEAGIEAAYALADIEPDPARCLASAGPLLEEAASRLAADWLPAGVQGETPGAGREL